MRAHKYHRKKFECNSLVSKKYYHSSHGWSINLIYVTTINKAMRNERKSCILIPSKVAFLSVCSIFVKLELNNVVTHFDNLIVTCEGCKRFFSFIHSMLFFLTFYLLHYMLFLRCLESAGE